MRMLVSTCLVHPLAFNVQIASYASKKNYDKHFTAKSSLKTYVKNVQEEKKVEQSYIKGNLFIPLKENSLKTFVNSLFIKMHKIFTSVS